ncbi:MAG: hypothetical protein ABII79_08570 [bacterium]
MRILLALLIIFTMTACGFNDKDRLYAKIVEDCRMFPAGPMCVGTSTGDQEKLNRKVFDLWVDDVINNPMEQDCIFNVECNGDADDHQQLRDCVGQTKSLIIPRDQDCARNCSEAYIDCGPEDCTEFDIEVCHRQDRLCMRFCPPG